MKSVSVDEGSPAAAPFVGAVDVALAEFYLFVGHETQALTNTRACYARRACRRSVSAQMNSPQLHVEHQ